MRRFHPKNQTACAILLIGELTLLCSTGCNRDATPSDEQIGSVSEAAPKEVVVTRAALQLWPRTLRVQGSLLADENAVIGSKIAGRVESVSVDLGSIVKQGQPMVVLDQRELELLVAQAEAQLRQACSAIGMTPQDDETKLDFKKSPPVMLEQALVDEAQAAVTRGDQLLPGRALSRGEYDTLVAALKTAQARYLSALNSVSEQVSLIGVRRADLDLARERLQEAQIIAPFDAVVSERMVAPGEYVQAGMPVITLVRADRLRFTAGVPESKAAGVKIGQKVEIRASGIDQPVVTSITRISPIVLLTSRSLRIEADVENPNLALQAGLFAEAEINVDPQAQTLVVPVAAVSQFAGVQKVWLVVDGQAKQQTVSTGRRDAGRVEILEGLQISDVVVANATDGRDGPVIAVQSPTRDDLHALVPGEEPPTPVYE